MATHMSAAAMAAQQRSSSGFGRGRGRGGPSAPGAGRGAGPTLEPPPLYPAIQLKRPSALSPEDAESLQYHRGIAEEIKKSPYYLKDRSIRRDIERYSDRYASAESSEETLYNMVKQHPYCTVIPKELLAEKYIPPRALGRRRADQLAARLRELEAKEKKKASSNEEGEEGEGNPNADEDALPGVDVEDDDADMLGDYADVLHYDDDDEYGDDDDGGRDDDGPVF